MSINSKEENDFIYFLVEKTVERQGRYNPGVLLYEKVGNASREISITSQKENTLGVAGP